MSSSFLVRPAERRDLANWAQMRAELWPCSSRQEHLAELEEGSKSTSFRGWVALSDDRCIGFAEAYIRPFANGCDSRPVVFLEGIWVGPDFRRFGVGRALVESVAEWARAQGIYELGSDAELTNTLSQTCHLKWGFEETERVVYYRMKLR
ncbi:MAG: N-acetyltransferase [Proteobacteria bacterium]|jgi:aminoglycoside 6'-N-acetyltransferase I|nr:MAG: N-acetyltransferase [Pseudomonadota bacterium]